MLSQALTNSAFLKFMKSKVFSSVNILKSLALIFTASCLAGIQFQLIQVFYGPHIDNHISTCQQTLDGMPGWKMHQSHYIGPHLVDGLHKLTEWDFATAYQVVTFLLLFLFFITLLLVAHSIWNAWLTAIATAVAAGFLNAFLMQGVWLYTWDLIHLILFTIFIWALLTRKPFWILALIMIIEIFNHDIIFVLAAWLAIDSIVKMTNRGQRFPKFEFKPHPKSLLFAIITGVSAYFIIDCLRESLFIEETTRESIITLMAAQGIEIKFVGDFPLFLPFNLDILKMSFLFENEMMIWEKYFDTTNLIVFNPLILGIPVVAMWGVLSQSRTISRISLLLLMLWTSIFASCPIYETRVWIALVPFLVLLVPIIYQRPEKHF